MTTGQQIFAWIGIVLYLFVIAVICHAEEISPPSPRAAAGEPVPPSTYNLPKEQVQEYRAIEAEVRALRAETALAIQNLDRRREEIVGQWKKLVGGELDGWQLDLTAGKLLSKDSAREAATLPRHTDDHGQTQADMDVVRARPSEGKKGKK